MEVPIWVHVLMALLCGALSGLAFWIRHQWRLEKALQDERAFLLEGLLADGEEKCYACHGNDAYALCRKCIEEQCGEAVPEFQERR